MNKTLSIKVFSSDLNQEVFCSNSAVIISKKNDSKEMTLYWDRDQRNVCAVLNHLIESNIKDDVVEIFTVYAHYVGGFDGKSYHGHGLLYSSDGNKFYKGNFAHGAPHGQGIQYNADGSIFVESVYKRDWGEWVEGKKEGKFMSNQPAYLGTRYAVLEFKSDNLTGDIEEYRFGSCVSRINVKTGLPDKSLKVCCLLRCI